MIGINTHEGRRRRRIARLRRRGRSRARAAQRRDRPPGHSPSRRSRASRLRPLHARSRPTSRGRKARRHYDQIVEAAARGRRSSTTTGTASRRTAPFASRRATTASGLRLWDGRRALTTPDASCSSAIRELERDRAARSANGDGHRRPGEMRAGVGAARRDARIRRRYRWTGRGWIRSIVDRRRPCVDCSLDAD